MDKQILLNNFGKLLIHSVRDWVIDGFHRAQSGQIKSKSGILIHEKLKKLDEDTLKILNELALYNIDSTMHYFLWMIEQNEEFDLIRYIDDEKNYVSLRDISDGLSGELYTEEGWIEKFSSYEPSYK